MSKTSEHCLDISDEVYRQHGVRRQNPNNIDFDNFSDGDKIFVKMDFIVNGYFLNEILPKINKKFVLITGVSDYSMNHTNHYLNILSNPLLIKWYSTNPIDLSHPKIEFVPIGFQEYERLGNNVEVIDKFFNLSVDYQNKLNKIYIPFHSNTNHSRASIINKMKELPFVDYQSNKLSFDSYLENISKYKYVLSLRGNGWDCHRNYEILLTGSVPILEKGPISHHFESLEIPHILLNDINVDIFDINFNFNLVKKFLTQQYHFNRFNHAQKE